jgi:hypothetical protein
MTLTDVIEEIASVDLFARDAKSDTLTQVSQIRVEL